MYINLSTLPVIQMTIFSSYWRCAHPLHSSPEQRHQEIFLLLTIDNLNIYATIGNRLGN